jgi:hypothetical protein
MTGDDVILTGSSSGTEARANLLSFEVSYVCGT